MDDFAMVAKKICEKLEYIKGGQKEAELQIKAGLFLNRLLKDTKNISSQNVDLNEWLQLFTDVMSDRSKEETLDEYIELIIGYLFDLFDHNRDGYISIEEYRDIFDIYEIDQFFVVKSFNNLDLNKDKRLSKQELNKAVETFLTSDDPLMKGNWIFGNWDG